MRRSRHRRRAGGLVPLVAILISAGAAAAVYFYSFRPGHDLALEPVASTQSGVSEAASLDPVPAREDVPPPPEPAEPSERFEPLPPLAESDAVVRAALETLWGKEAVARVLVPDDLVSRFVATIDNLPNPKVALKLRPVQPLGGAAPVRRESGIVLGEEHFARYAPLASLVERTSVAQLEALYLRFHPLLQEAYEDLGYPGESFDDRLSEVIDHLLATPDVRAPIAVVRPKVYYEFADPALEERSAGQKLLIRMGPHNAAIVKRRLREMRELLTAEPPSSGEGRRAPR
jgi:hypothetical protein